MSSFVENYGISIEIGTCFTRCGFAGEFAPRRIIRNDPSFVRYLSIERTVELKGDEHIRHLIHEHFRKIFQSILFITLKGKHHVFVSLNIFHNEHFRRHIEYVLKQKFGVKNVSFLCSQICTLFGAGSTTMSALVIDCGFEETRIVPVYKGNIISNSLRIVKIGGRWSMAKLKSALVEHNLKERGKDFSADLCESVLEDILVRVCFCDNTISTKEGIEPPKSDKSLTFFDPQSVTYKTLRNHQITIPIEQRSKIFDSIFVGDEENVSLPLSIIECLLSCPSDIRKDVVSNIILCGGLSEVVGFDLKLFTQLSYIIGSSSSLSSSSLSSLENSSKEQEKENDHLESSASLKNLFEKMRIYQGKDPVSQISWIGLSIFANMLTIDPKKKDFVKEKMEIEIERKKKLLSHTMFRNFKKSF